MAKTKKTQYYHGLNSSGYEEALAFRHPGEYPWWTVVVNGESFDLGIEHAKALLPVIKQIAETKED